jgi:hypothetical protein
MQAAVGNERIELGENELGPVLESCPFCGRTANSPVLALQTAPKVELMSCGGCGADYAARMPTRAALDAYYARYYAHPKYRGLAEAVHFSQPERLADHLMSCMHPDFPREIRILDFGGGDGSIAVLLAERLIRAGAGRVDIVLVDYGTSLRTPGDRSIRIARAANLGALDRGEYDIVIASASLEHVPELRETLTALLGKMRRGAQFYARTPYMTPLIRFVHRAGLRVDFGWPAHLYDLGESFWSRLPTTMGLGEGYRVTASRPAIVESTFASAPLRTTAAHLLKAPWRLFGERYGLVGGWEAVIERGR